MPSAFPLPPSDLRIDHQLPSGNILFLQNPNPTFSWALRHGRRGAVQSAYRLTLSQVGAQIWDSGEVESNRSVGVRFATSPPLASDADYTWTVTWRDEQNKWSPPAPPSPFSTALLASANADWSGTAWVGGLAGDDQRNQFRCSFRLPPFLANVARARCYIAAPGYHTTHLNSIPLQRADDASIGPIVQFDRRVPYDAFDCTAALRAGGAENVLATTLGRGWFALADGNGQTDALGYHTIGARSLRVLVTAELETLNFTAITAPTNPTTTPATTRRWRLDGNGWKHAEGPIVFDSLFLGTVVDGRRETAGWRDAGFDDAGWDDALVLHGPRASNDASTTTSPLLPLTASAPALVLPELPPIRRLSPHVPVAATETAPGVALLDFGVNMAATCRIVVDDAAAVTPGHTMTLRRAEGVLDDGRTLSQTWLLKGARENCSYTFRADGTREVYEDTFAYFGFRFLEIKGWPGGGAPPVDAVTCWATHTDLPRTSQIFFSPPTNNSSGGGARAAALLNEVQGMIANSALSNFHSHPTDCPTREKRGWTGDGGHVAETLMMNFDMGAAYAKWLTDINDAATLSKGVVPEMAPYIFASRSAANSDPAWGAGFVDLLGWHYRYHGDKALLEAHWDAAVSYVDGHLAHYVPNGSALLTTSYPGTRYGDWCAPSGEPLSPSVARHTSNVISGFFWVRQLEVLAQVARRLGRTAAAASYAARAASARTQFGALYFDAASGVFRDPQWTPVQGPHVFQTEQALALFLALDLGDAYGDLGAPKPAAIVAPRGVASAAAALAADIGQRGIVGGGMLEARGGASPHLGAGMVGVKYLLPVLTATGRGDLALAALAAPTYPSFGYMAAHGEGSLWERWEGGNHAISGSRNHIMLGSPGQWLFQGAAGLRLGRGAIAWDRIEVVPLVAVARNASLGLGGVDAIVGTPRGALHLAWRVAPAGGTPLCDVAAEMDLLREPLTLACDQGGGGGSGGAATISAIEFSSYGTPAGSCAAPGAFATDAACNAKSSRSVVEKACLGHRSCTLYANTSQFGGADPCPGTPKRLAVVARCAGGCRRSFGLNVTVPIGSSATITLPTSSGGHAPAKITESGVTFYRGGSFLPGTAEGVRAARAIDGGGGFEVQVGGGAYVFVLWLC